ncbi:MAG: ABC transporter substrate-binding protein, partial [Polyangiaceae bacterium]
FYTVGPHSFVGTMIAKAGGRDIVPESLGDFPKISPEAVIAGNPEVIFGVPLRDARVRPGWDKIDAVRSGRVYKLSPEEGELVARPGPRIAEGLRVLLRHIHPEVAEGGP